MDPILQKTKALIKNVTRPSFLEFYADKNVGKPEDHVQYNSQILIWKVGAAIFCHIFLPFLPVFDLHRQPPEITVWSQLLQTVHSGRVLNCLHSEIKIFWPRLMPLKVQGENKIWQFFHF